jgi:rubrerythrin
MLKQDPCTPILAHLANDSLRIPLALRSFAQIERKGAVWLKDIPEAIVTPEILQQQSDELRHADLLDSLAGEMNVVRFGQHTTFTDIYLNGLRRGLDRICIRKKKGDGGKISQKDLYLARYSVLGILFERRAYRIYSVLAASTKNDQIQKLMKQLVVEEKEHYVFALKSLKESVHTLNTSTEELFTMEGELALCWIKNLNTLPC